ncbi:hypothetical protein RJ640_013750 [Escallonia rubra]|uniref:UBN2_2 domain-containing protein n=1 Tax=Escallonia rubra TaxID=112253 RepID=A0AA88R2Z4_9ASTE|nr:hypothetical protein RJ640_013750 [Escallonia rubra]
MRQAVAASKPSRASTRQPWLRSRAARAAHTPSQRGAALSRAITRLTRQKGTAHAFHARVPHTRLLQEPAALSHTHDGAWRRVRTVFWPYDELPTCKALWEQLKFSFGGSSTTRLRSLVIKFEEYTKDPKHTMSEHLRVMSNMIGKLRDAGHALTNEQQVRAVIRSLPASWANMKQILTHSENIKNFSDVSQHVILEAET